MYLIIIVYCQRQKNTLILKPSFITFHLLTKACLTLTKFCASREKLNLSSILVVGGPPLPTRGDVKYSDSLTLLASPLFSWHGCSVDRGNFEFALEHHLRSSPGQSEEWIARLITGGGSNELVRNRVRFVWYSVCVLCEVWNKSLCLRIKLGSLCSPNPANRQP